MQCNKFLHQQVTLLDSLRKRCNFLKEVVRELGLQNVTVAWGRSEKFGQDLAYREVNCSALISKTG